ncbi:MAG: YkgJ family cysteine cluster protein [Bacteroidota bacterium]|nr:YkgJ family cysteine cluster protein [Bacteroidota bacterium]
MASIIKYNLRYFWKKASLRKRSFRRFLTRLEKERPRGLDGLAALAEKEVWSEVDCRSCANCCKTMTPVYSSKDIRRIAAHQGMTAAAFKKKWLRKEKNTGDWLNKTTPCQFLDAGTNECTIYEVRPADCAGFPHLSKKRMTDYMHVHKQNIDLCPATFKLVEKMMERLGE